MVTCLYPCQKNKKHEIVVLKNKESICMSFYRKTISNFSDDYGTPNKFDENDLLNENIWGNVSFPPDYYQQLLNVSHIPMISEDNQSMLVNNRMCSDQISKSLKIYKETMEEKNSINYTFNPKQTFQFPLVSTPLKNRPFDELSSEIMNEYLLKSNLSYTKSIIYKAANKIFNRVTSQIIDEEIKEARESLSASTHAYNSKVIEKFGEFKTIISLSVEEKAMLKKELDQMNLDRVSYRKSLVSAKKSVRMNVVKISCGKRSQAKQQFDIEMSHFNKNGSVFRGVGLVSDAQNKQSDDYFKALPLRLVQKNFNNEKFRNVYNSGRGPGPEFFTDQKNSFQSNWDLFQETLHGTLLDQLTTVVSRLCNTLFVESTRTFNKDFIKVDNLGFDNLIILIRGGSKIYKNQTSKLFKVMFYCSLEDMIFSGYQENEHFECFPSVDKCLVVTPWMQLHQDALLDGLSFRHRTFMNLYTSQVRCKSPLDGTIPRINMLPVMLFLHNRRKTEKFMHNCRYLIVNPLASHANLTGIIKTFADFNYTYFDAWLRHCINTNYFNFSSCLATVALDKTGNADGAISDSGLLDLWFSDPLNNTDHLTSFIYATYMMTKAPVNSSVEQSSNLWEILEDVLQYDLLHGDVEGLDDVSLRFDVRNFDESVYQDDFKYDPVFCQYLGFKMCSF